MKDQTFEELAKLYPDLFQKARIEHFECGDGWYTILRSLCALISHDVQQLRYQIAYYSDEGKQDKMQEAEVKLAAAIEALPVMAQVKEKFGGLRFYYDGGSSEINHWVEFAEMMASHTCEDCGNPGKKRNEGWIKTMCDTCHKKAYPEAYSAGPKSSKKGAKLSDETE